METNKPQSSLPAELTYHTVIRELEGCHATTLYTSEEEHSGDFQMSHPGANYESFPVVTLFVERAKNHSFDNHLHVYARPAELEYLGYFVKLKGTVEKIVSRDERLLKVTLSVKTVQLMKAANVSVKETWSVDDQE